MQACYTLETPKYYTSYRPSVSNDLEDDSKGGGKAFACLDSNDTVCDN